MLKQRSFAIVVMPSMLVLAAEVAAQAEIVQMPPSGDSMLTQHPNLGAGSSPQGSRGDMYSIGPYNGYPNHEQVSRPLLKFDLLSFAGRTVTGTSASVTLHCAGYWKMPSNPATYQDLYAYPVLVSWDEATVTYNNFGGTGGVQPSKYGAMLSSVRVPLSASGASVSWVIPNWLVQSWIDNPSANNGVVFIPGSLHDTPEFCWLSREASVPPSLSFELVDVPEPSTVLLLATASLFFMRRREKQ